MEKIEGCSNRVLEVDLGGRTFETVGITEEMRRNFLGAKGLGLKLIYDRLAPGTAPLGPDNIIAFMPGILAGTGAPCSARFAAMTKSPLTGIMVASSCGGPFGIALKTAGWDGLLVRGRATSPVWLDITSDGVAFKDAADIWGMEIPEAQAVLDVKKTGSLVIGPAGENKVRFANVASGHRFLGRGGLGAVMGSKNLKAVRANGRAFSIKPVDPEAFKKVRRTATAYINQNALTADRYRNFGTAANVKPCNAANILPVNNFSDGRHPDAQKVFGETMAESHKTVHNTCKPCTIQCGHKGTFKDSTLSAPEFETIGLLGTSLGIFDLEKIAEWNAICGRLGMDTISAGGTLAWVMEATAEGLLDSGLAFGDANGIDQALADIAAMRGLGREMAMGTRFLSETYGGKSFALQVKGLEMAAYDPRGSVGQGLSYAVANRGACHLSAYLVAQEIYLDLLNPENPSGKAKWVRYFEDLGCCINSLQTCQFTMFAFLLEPPLSKWTPKPLLGFLMQHLPGMAIPLVDFSLYLKLWNSVTGIRLTKGEFMRAGQRIHVLERLMNTREGISAKDDVLPQRLTAQGRESDPEKRTVPLEEMRTAYYKVRGYDENGIPTPKLLRELGLAESCRS